MSIIPIHLVGVTAHWSHCGAKVRRGSKTTTREQEITCKKCRELLAKKPRNHE